MSVNFFIKGERFSYEDDNLPLNLANANARSVLEWLGYDPSPDLYGELDPVDLAARCRRRLWPEFRDQDTGIPMTQEGRVINCGRRPGYLLERTQDLLSLAERAKGQTIVFG